jgi:hypothetical protein
VSAIGSIVAAAVGAALLSAAPAAADRRAQATRYTIRAAFDPATGRLDGEERLEWHNPSTTPVKVVRLTLGEDAMAVRVTALSRAGSSEDLLRTATVSAPDPGSGNRRSILQVNLSNELYAGDLVALDLHWTATASSDVAWGGTFLFADWFPRVDGYAAYEVTLQVPAGWTVAATGHEQGEATSPSGGRRFVQQSVPRFGWATSRSWVERRARVDRAAGPPVDVHLFLQPEHALQGDRLLAAIEAVLPGRGVPWVSYPYQDLAVVDLPWRHPLRGAVLPTLLALSLRWIEPRYASDTEIDVARLLAEHEWRTTIEANAGDWPWFSLALENETANRLARPIVAAQLNSTLARPFLVARFFGGFVPYLVRSVRVDRPVEVGTPDEVDARAEVRWVETLERYLGWPTFEAIVATLFEKFEFAAAGPDEFVATAESVSGRDLNWLFNQLGPGVRRFDYAIDRVDSRRDADGRYLLDVVVTRRGDGIFSGTSKPRVGPYESGRGVEIAVEFADGESRSEHWDGRDVQKTFSYNSVAPIDRVIVDPNETLQLDVNRTNNSWTRQPRTATAATRWTLRWLTWIEDLLVGYCFLV